MKYVAIIRKDDESDFGVDFPDLPGCISAGSTLAEALDMGREALGLHLYGLRDTGEAFPVPRRIDQISLEELGDDVIATVVLEPVEGSDDAAAIASAVRLAELVELLPVSRDEVAKALGVSSATLRGWLRTGRGESISRRQSGAAAPSARIIFRAIGLVRDHVERCARALRLAA